MFSQERAPELNQFLVLIGCNGRVRSHYPIYLTGPIMLVCCFALGRHRDICHNWHVIAGNGGLRSDGGKWRAVNSTLNLARWKENSFTCAVVAYTDGECNCEAQSSNRLERERREENENDLPGKYQARSGAGRQLPHLPKGGKI